MYLFFFFLKEASYVFFFLCITTFSVAWHKRLGNRHKVDIYPEIGIILCYFFHPCLSCGIILSSGKLHLQGAKSSWTNDCKAVSCTHINYLFINNLTIKQVKGQEMIARIVFKRPIKASEIGNIYTVCEKKSNREIAGTLEVLKLTVWYILWKAENIGELGHTKWYGFSTKKQWCMVTWSLPW